MKTFYTLLVLLTFGVLLRFSALRPFDHSYSHADAVVSGALALSMRNASASLAPNLAALIQKSDLSVRRQAARDALTSPQDFIYKDHKWPGTNPVVKFRININTAQAGGSNGSVADFRNAIIAAADTWNMEPKAAFTLQYDGETNVTEVGLKNPGSDGINEIVFMHQGITNTAGLGAFFFKKTTGEIVEGDIWLNDDYKWDATGAPSGDELDLQSGVLHELGHWLALGHDTSEASVMFAALDSGVLKRELGPDDQAAIEFIYPCSAVPCNPPTPSPTQTLTPTSIATPLPFPSTTATATPIPDSTAQTIATPTPVASIGNQSNIYLPVIKK